MEDTKKVFILVFLALNAIFWGLFPHTEHCKVFTYFKNVTKSSMKCPEHKYHVLMGFVFYILSVYYAQKDAFH